MYCSVLLTIVQPYCSVEIKPGNLENCMTILYYDYSDQIDHGYQYC